MTVDMGDYTEEARKIVEKSYSIVEEYIPGDTPENRILQRVVIATGDVNFKDLIVFKNDPVNAGIEALKREAPVYTDVEMVKAGINKRYISSKVECVLSFTPRYIKTTRTAAGFQALADELNNSIVIIGNAPSAAMTLCEMVEDGISPALIIATPVGFVNAAESKECIRKLPLPSITSTGTRGGSTVAVAIMNAIAVTFRESVRMEK